MHGEEPAGFLHADVSGLLRPWLSRDLFDCYVGVKRAEIPPLQDADPEEIRERYPRVY